MLRRWQLLLKAGRSDIAVLSTSSRRGEDIAPYLRSVRETDR